MGKKSNGLFAGNKPLLNLKELLDRTYNVLSKNHHSQKIVLPEIAFHRISHSYDEHKGDRYGEIYYGSARLFELDGKTWAVARGSAGNHWLEKSHRAGDLLALELRVGEQTPEQAQEHLYKDGIVRISSKIPEQISEGLRKGISNSSGFANSLVFERAST